MELHSSAANTIAFFHALAQVLQDMRDVLPPITDPQQAAAQEWTMEIYSSYRMQLASLPETVSQQMVNI